MSIPEALKYIRKVSFLSQEALAKELGVAYSTVNRWETGKTKPNYQAMKKIDMFCKKQSIDINISDAIE